MKGLAAIMGREYYTTLVARNARAKDLRSRGAQNVKVRSSRNQAFDANAVYGSTACGVCHFSVLYIVEWGF